MTIKILMLDPTILVVGRRSLHQKKSWKRGTGVRCLSLMMTEKMVENLQEREKR